MNVFIYGASALTPADTSLTILGLKGTGGRGLTACLVALHTFGHLASGAGASFLSNAWRGLFFHRQGLLSVFPVNRWVSHSLLVFFPTTTLPEKSSCHGHVSFYWASDFTPLCLAAPLYDNCHHWKQPETASQTTLDTSSCVFGAAGYYPLAKCVLVFPKTEAGGKH